MTTHPTTLVIGANGKTGRRVARKLEDRGYLVRRGSRSGKPPFDWEDANTWPAALDGVQQIYITFQPDLAVPGAIAIIERFTRLAEERGIDKLVLLSGRGEEAAQICEGIVQRSSVASTIVRASWFAQNFSEGFFVEPIRQGVLALPVDDVREAFIDVEDIADVAVTALTEPGHEGQLYEVTGPRLMTFAEAVAAISEASGRRARYQPITADAFRDAMAQSVPRPMADFYTELVQTTLDGRNAYVADGVERALGRAPRDFADYARDAAATGGLVMSATPMQIGLWSLAVSAGIAGGATFAFSSFIMRAFDRLPASEAVRAMQSINVTAINPAFMIVLMGTGAGALALSAVQGFAGDGVDPWLVAGTVIYVLGVVAVTVAGNVPLNEALAKVTPTSLTSSSWAGYAAPWTAYNHARTLAAALAALAFMVAAR